MRFITLLLLAPLCALAGEPLAAPGGGRLIGPTVVLLAPAGETVRDTTIAAHDGGKTVDVYAVVGVKGKVARIRHRRSEDAGASWGDTNDIPIELDNRAQWIRVFRVDGRQWLVVGNNPSLPPQTPRMTHFGGKKYTGFPGWVSIARIGKDGKTCETNSGRMRLENPGKVVFSHYSWGASFRMAAKGDTAVLIGCERFFLRKKWMWGQFACRTTDNAKTWEKPSFLVVALRGLNILKPAYILREGPAFDVYMGNNHTNKVERYNYGPKGWSHPDKDVAGVGKVNYWHDGYEEADGTAVITDTISTAKAGAKKKRYGVIEYAQRDGKWAERGRIDAGIDKPYSALTTVRGKLRAHRFYGIGKTILSSDGGKTWISAGFTAAVKSGQSAMIPGKGYAVIRGGAFTTPEGEKRQAVRMEILVTK